MTKYFVFIDQSGSYSSSIYELFIPLNTAFISKLKEYGCDIEEANKLYNYYKKITDALFHSTIGLWKNEKEDKQTKEWLEKFKVEFIKKHLWLGGLNK